MLLPATLQIALSEHLVSHGCWHVARMPGQETLRARFPGECDAQLHAYNEPGGGCDFLHYHRRMMRHFYWLLQTAALPHFEWTPWTNAMLPVWVEDAVRREKDDFHLCAAYTTIDRLKVEGTLDELGMFIETAADRGQTPAPAGAGIHTRVHRAITVAESELYPGDTTGEMQRLERAPLNVFFWTLHGWIDDIYADWQRAHGEIPDRSAAEMQHVHVTCVGMPKLPE
jgi:Common central domain of tyrosinase